MAFGAFLRRLMDYLVEAQKFIRFAQKASHPDVIVENLKIAEWCLTQAIVERDRMAREKSRK
jgi:hypothetical protein